MERDAKLECESQFWNGKSSVPSEYDPAVYRVAATDRYDRSVPWLPYQGFPQYVQCMLDHLGAIEGKRVLDLGSGTGFVASLLAANGAHVDAIDISEASLDIARWRAEVSGVADRIRFHNMAAETLTFEDQSFDSVCGAFVLHHLDLSIGVPELRRVLRPGGTGAFIETCGGSGLLMAARRCLPGRLGIEKASSDDEVPLGPAARAALRGEFGDTVRFDFPSTLLFRMLSYIPPFHMRPAQGFLAAVDASIHLIPALRSQSYYGVVALRRE